LKSHNQPTKSRVNLSLFGLILLTIIVFISAVGLRMAYGSLDELSDGRSDYIEARIRADSEAWSEIVRYARNLNRFFIHHRGFDGVACPSAITEDDIAEDVAFLTNMLSFELMEALNRFISGVYNQGTSPSGAYNAQDELVNSLAGLAPFYINSLEERWQVRLSERVANFTAIQNYLETTQEFVYILHDGVLDETFHNIDAYDIDLFLQEEVYAIINLSDIPDTFNGIPLNEGFARGSISGLIALPIRQPAGSVVTLAAERANASWQSSVEAARGVTHVYIGLTLGVLLITIVVMLKVVLPDLSGAWNGVLSGAEFYFKLPLLLKTLFAIYALAFVSGFIGEPLAQRLRLGHWIPLYLAFVVIMFSAILLVYALRGKYRLWDELELRIAKKIVLGFGIIRRLSAVFLPTIWVALVLCGISSLFLGLYLLYSISIAPVTSMLIVFLCIAAFGAFVASFILLLVLTTYAESYYYIKIIAEGRPVIIPEQQGIFGKPLNVINGLSHGIQASLEEQLQAERTKTELITSVSHDLKTPLTSIINYVDLLKKSNIEERSAREYVDILENKSERLKILIEDLFEAAKLTSGSMELVLEPVDITQLLTQAIGELSDKFESCDIDIRYNPPENKLIAMLDGQRMWRVFENLLNNIANYSPPGSRAYITLEQHDEEIEIVMKNISLYPLDINANELFERFKRGDTARTTEGSGLGLSIAKDIVELHGGQVEIAIDGDLFKVILRLKLAISKDGD